MKKISDYYTHFKAVSDGYLELILSVSIGSDFLNENFISDHIKCNLKCSHLQNDIINCDWIVTVIKYQYCPFQVFCRMPPRMREMYDVVAEYSQYSTLAGEEKSLCSIIDAQHVVGNPGWVLGVWAKFFWGGQKIEGGTLIVLYCIFITKVFKLKPLPLRSIYEFDVPKVRRWGSSRNYKQRIKDIFIV